jgi:acyl-CoA synthetase (AMP-forming)/AMP-acid ligase II
MLEAAARDAGDAPFLTDTRDGTVLTYRGLRDAASGLAASLRDRGVGPGDRVAFATRNDPFFFPLFFAAASRGAALVPMNPDLHPDERADVLAHAAPRLVLDRPEPLPVAAPAADPVSVDADAAALVVFTSGTTGRGKGIVLTPRNLAAMSGSLSRFYRYAPGQRFLSVLPFHHINAPVLTGLACLAGRSHVLLADVFGLAVARRYWEIARDGKVDVISLTPSIAAALLKLYPRGRTPPAPSVKYGLVGTARFEPETWRKFEEVFGLPCYQGYGLTETTVWACMTPTDARKRRDTAGVPVDCEVRVDASGEVLIRGDCVAKGYLDAPDLTARVFADGWLRTGDLGRLEDGQLVITGRRKSLIKRAGVVVFPEELDACLKEHPSVAESCTLGLPDPVLGERVVSACAVKGRVAADALRAHLARRLSVHKLPDEVALLRRLPRTPIGKVDVSRLRLLLSGDAVRAAMRAFLTQKVRRAPVADRARLEETVRRALFLERPLRFVGFWGAGGRTEAAEADLRALDRLKAVADGVDQGLGLPLARVELVLADVHARSNGVPAPSAERYFAAVRREASARGIACVRQSALWRKHGLDYRRLAAAAASRRDASAWDAFPLKKLFTERAARHARGGAAVARRYWTLLRAENPVLARHYRGGVFFTYNGAESAPCLPDLPTVHWFSTKKGVSEKPWFARA